MTRRAEELAQRKLIAIGGDPNAIVEQSIERGWKGLFPLDTVKRGAFGRGPQLTEAGLLPEVQAWLDQQTDIGPQGGVIEGECHEV
jgi:hypothetical protein